MIQSSKTSALFAAIALSAAGAPALADQPEVLGQTRVYATLSGYEETPQAINSAGTGVFTAQIHPDGSAIDYRLTYSGLTGVSQSHIHFGREATTGGIVLFLCTNLTPPAGVPTPPACPAAAGSVSGTLTMADVVAVPGQDIAAGADGFAALLKAIREDSAYVNVHTAAHAGGEIRGRLITRGPFRGN